MEILFTLLIFLALTGVFALLGLNVWVWPRAAIDRVTASAADPQSQEVSHPSLAFRDLLKQLYGAKFIMAILVPVMAVGPIAGASWESSTKVMASLASVAIGFFAPNE